MRHSGTEVGMKQDIIVLLPYFWSLTLDLLYQIATDTSKKEAFILKYSCRFFILLIIKGGLNSLKSQASFCYFFQQLFRGKVRWESTCTLPILQRLIRYISVYQYSVYLRQTSKFCPSVLMMGVHFIWINKVPYPTESIYKRAISKNNDLSTVVRVSKKIKMND